MQTAKNFCHVLERKGGERGGEGGGGGEGERREGGGEREEEGRKVKSKKRNMDARGGGKGRDTANNTDNLNSTELRLASFPGLFSPIFKRGLGTRLN